MQEAYGGFAALYDPLMQDVDYDGWAKYLASFLPPGAMVADCACGTGAITIRLARMGFSVIGVDISPEMLEQAASKARKAGLRIPFVCQDMAGLQLHRPCQGIVCACDGVNYLDNLEDVEAFFSAAHRALCPGGWLLFDVSSAYKLETILGNNTFAQAEGDCAYIWDNAFDEESRLLEMRLTFFQREADGRYRRFAERHIQRAHTQEELTHALERAGFAAQVFDAFTRQAPGPESQRLQFVAQRNQT